MGRLAKSHGRTRNDTGVIEKSPSLHAHAFDLVKEVGLALPHVEGAIRYDGSPVLKVAGVFMAGLATHCSAEPNTLVVRADLDERECFIEDAPDTYYLTDYYRRYQLILVRLDHVSRDALRELLASSHRLSLPKTRLRHVTPPGARAATRREPPGPRAARTPWHRSK